MNLILIQPDELKGNMVVLTDDRARHILNVLRVNKGDRLRIGLMNGPLGTATVQSVNNGVVVLSCEFEDAPPDQPSTDLLLAMPRPKVMKRLWAQLAAIGVGRIVLVRADKVERYYFDSHVLEPEIYTKLLVEGLQQARCTHLPEVIIRKRFKPFVEDEMDALFGGQRKLLADPSGTQGWDTVTPSMDRGTRTVLAIGPEGGWTPYEIDHLQHHGFELFSLGRRILRTDTAVIGLLSRLCDS